MNTNITNLTAWARKLIDDANNDVTFDVSWFEDTKNARFAIVGGWSGGFSEEYNDILCTSKSNPDYAMCVKIVVNKGPYAYADFDSLNMPTSRDGEVDDTCIVLERGEDPFLLAQFFAGELERINEEYDELWELYK